MDAWSAIFTSHGTPLDPAASNQFVQSGWTGTNWAPAAEIIRYTYTLNGGWPQADVARFASMLKTALSPLRLRHRRRSEAFRRRLEPRRSRSFRTATGKT